MQLNCCMRAHGKLGEAKSVGCTCLRLRKASRRVSQIYDRALEPCGLTVTQYGLLGHIAAFDGIGVGALAARMVMDPTTLTRNLKPLLEQALVVLVPDPARSARTPPAPDRGRTADICPGQTRMETRATAPRAGARRTRRARAKCRSRSRPCAIGRGTGGRPRARHDRCLATDRNGEGLAGDAGAKSRPPCVSAFRERLSPCQTSP